MNTLLKLLSADKPSIRADLPQARQGESIWLDSWLSRTRGGRSEKLRLLGRFRVVSSVLVQSRGQQVLDIEPVGDSPHWVAVKKPDGLVLGPCQTHPLVDGGP
jgi:hypothetical protein